MIPKFLSLPVLKGVSTVTAVVLFFIFAMFIKIDEQQDVSNKSDE